MRIPTIDKQTMYFSLFVSNSIVYELDENGNKINDGTAENPIWRETGTTEALYGTPIKFDATISSQLNELQARAYGVDQSNVYCIIETEKGEFPITFGTKIWKESEIVWKDSEHTIPDVSSSDYTVKGVLDEYIPFDRFLLQRNNK